VQEFDPIVLLASLLSVFAVFMINRWLGGYTPAHLASSGDALARLRLDFPTFADQESVLGSDGKSAIVAGADGSLALVEAIGDRFLTRRLAPGDIAALFLEPSGEADGQRLRLQLNDFTNPAFEILLTAEVDGAAWHQRLTVFHGPTQSAAEAGSHG
jgi:hypothetical protein